MFDSYLYIGLPFFGACFGLAIATSLQQLKWNVQPLLLAFSGAFLISITLFELLQKVYHAPDFVPGYWIIGGILLQIGLELFSRGVEQGHAHAQKTHRFPWLLWASLSLHAFIEGIPMAAIPQLAWGLMIHKIPITIAIYSLLVPHNKGNSMMHYLPIIIFALLTPLGGLLGSFFSSTYLFQIPTTALVIGILLHIGTTILFESNEGHRFTGAKMLAIILGFVLGGSI